MGAENQAVFLSYASQDVAAARRICEALRAAGVEVWFDQNELVGGDVWDAKIRKQIAECALFVPVISAHTQARGEGYFRIEWRLAAQRTHAMADDTTFLLPVVIDDTRDAEARVPSEFKSVQWTRLAGGEGAGKFCARVAGLLGGGAVPPPASEGPRRRLERRAAPRRKPAFLLGSAVAATLLALAFWQPWQQTPRPPQTKLETIERPASEARQLLARAKDLLGEIDLSRAELDAADDLCRRAAALVSTDAEVLATWSMVDSHIVYFDPSEPPARREQARTKASRALQIAPAGFEPRLAQACYLVRGRGEHGKPDSPAEAEALLRTLLKERPAEPRVLHALGTLHRNVEDFDKARAAFEALARLPSHAALAWTEIGWMAAMSQSDFRAAEAAVERSLALRPLFEALSLRVWLDIMWHGNPDRARADLARISEARRREDKGVDLAMCVYYYTHDFEAMTRLLREVPRDWLSGYNAGPLAAYAAWAHAGAGRKDLARLQWQAALKLVEQRLEEKPNAPLLLRWKGTILAELGHRAEAEPLLRAARDLMPGRDLFFDLGDAIVLKQYDQTLTLLEESTKKGPAFGNTSALLRLSPAYDELRALPRFQALQERVAADPRFTPNPKAAGAPTSGADAKSVAVLAFESRSDDKDAEDFSDGVSEELINALARVPGLTVKGRTSAFYFKRRQASSEEIAKMLGVAYLVRGSVRRADGKVRIAAQLSRARTDEVVWSSGPLERELKDVFAVQEEIARLIAQALSVHLGAPAKRPAGSGDAEANRLALQGLTLLNRENVESWKTARRLLQEAVERDREFALAWAGLARAHCELATEMVDMDTNFKIAREAAERAIALQPSLPDGHLVLARIHFYYDWNWRAFQAELQTALALAPADPDVHNMLTREANMAGRLAEAVSLGTRAVELDPLNNGALSALCRAHLNGGNVAAAEPLMVQMAELGLSRYFKPFVRLMQGRFQEALQESALEPEEHYRLCWVAMAQWSLGRRSESDAALSELKAKLAGVAPYQIAQACAWRGEHDEAFRWLESGYRVHDTGLPLLKTDVLLKNLRDDPRWEPLLRKMKLADDQLQ